MVVSSKGTGLAWSSASTEDWGAAVFRGASVLRLGSSDFLGSAVEQAADQLMRLVLELRSPHGGWPENLPQTAENLVAYVEEEAEDLIEKLEAARLWRSLPLPSAPISDGMLLSVLVPHLLWGIASSSFEMIRLLEGMKARLSYPDGSFKVMVIRLVPLLRFAAEGSSVDLDLLTQTSPQESLLDPQIPLQLVDSDIDSGPTTVGALTQSGVELLENDRPAWRALMGEGWAIDWLFPRSDWQSGKLMLRLALAAVDSYFSFQDTKPSSLQERPASAPGAAPLGPVDLRSGDMEEPGLALESTPEPIASSVDFHRAISEVLPQDGDVGIGGTSPSFTLDDFAETLSEATPLPLSHHPAELHHGLASVFPDGISGKWSEQGPAPDVVVLSPPQDPVSPLAGAWLTFTDEEWVQSFLLTVAQQSFRRRLNQKVWAGDGDSMDCLAVVAAAFAVSHQVQGRHGPVSCTFVHQPILGVDLWPRLRWHLTRASELLMQLVGGLPIRYLSPHQNWQAGELFWHPTVTTVSPDQRSPIDLATGQPLEADLEEIAEETVIVPLVPTEIAGTLSVESLNQHIARELERQVPALMALRQGVSVDIHALDSAQDCCPGHLILDWTYTISVGAG